MRRTILAVGGLVLAGGVAAGGYAYLSGRAATVSASAAEIEAGRALYQANCAACHGAQGQGQPDWRTRKDNGKLPAPPLNGDGHTWHHPDGQLIAMITQGIEALAPAGYESDMASFGDRLSEAQIRDVLAYLKSTWPAAKLARQQEITARAGQ
jgi:mono/diheme cytochrome c family protein